MSALDALRETLAVFTPDIREDTDYVVRPESRLDDLGTVPGLTWGDLRAIEGAVREQIAADIESLPNILSATVNGRIDVGTAARIARGGAR